jgi:MFS transporter, SP family, arabinose:H+ symporter
MKLSPTLLASAVIAALGGFLFGFDTVVISGAEQKIQSLWGLSDKMHGLATSSALWGTMLGALLGGGPSDRYGRKKMLLVTGLLYLISALWCGLAQGVYSFMAARFMGGVGIGISSVVSPLYISEIAPPKLRGRLTGMFQFNLVFGILIAFLSNAWLARVGGENAWRWMLGIVAVPSLIYTMLCFVIPESPRWLINLRGDRPAGLQSLRKIDLEASDAELEQMADEIALHEGQRDPAGNKPTTPFWSRRHRRPIMLAILIAFFNQFSGINAVLYFAPRIFEMTGLGEQAALLTSAGVGVINLVFTFVALGLIDKLGRRTLLYIGSVGYILSLGLCSWAFFRESFGAVPFGIFAFIASHAIGQGAVVWVLISEIFPNEHRASGQSLGCFTIWVSAALITFLFPIAVANVPPGYIFAFFCGMMMLQLLWVWWMVPETKGIPLEEIQQRLQST